MATEQEPVPSCSGAKPPEKMTLKVWDGQKTKGKLMTVLGFQDLLDKVRQKFELSLDTSITIILEDGCEIDDEESLLVVCQERKFPSVIFLKENEEAPLPSESTEQSKFAYIMANLKKKEGAKRVSTD